MILARTWFLVFYVFHFKSSIAWQKRRIPFLNALRLSHFIFFIIITRAYLKLPFFNLKPIARTSKKLIFFRFPINLNRSHCRIIMIKSWTWGCCFIIFIFFIIVISVQILCWNNFCVLLFLHASHCFWSETWRLF